MKERTIRRIVLSIVFVMAIIVFSFWTNRENTEMTADMDIATLPTLSFKTVDENANLLVGHKKEMNLAAVRDTITVYEESGKLEMKIQQDEDDVDSVLYEIYTLDGKEKLHQESIDTVKKDVVLNIGGKLAKAQEAVLKITLDFKGTPIYYYTRILEDQDFHIKECVKYVGELHTNILKKQNEDAVKKVMESNAQGDNSTLQHVTIHSDLSHILWGKLKPKIKGNVQVEIKEAKEAYTAVLLNYQVTCKGDNNEEELYNVKEFFKVSYGKERVYLLEYDRTMEEVFNTANVVLGSKGVVLGIANEETEYKVNRDGTIVAFIQANELWNYNQKKDVFSLVFSFAASKKRDERHLTDNHTIQILSIEDDGNMTFSVSGYMNRGNHEGESGIAVYYYYADENCTEEVAFIPSSESHAVMKQTIGESAYYNREQEVLYLLSDGTLRKITMEDAIEKILVKGLEKGQYVTSDDGHLFAYQKTTNAGVVTEVRDFAKNSKKEIAAADDEIIVPLGFVGNDFVYGISKPENVGSDAGGMTVQAMHRIEIRNQKNKIIKTYEQEGIYVLRAFIENNMITLKKGVKDGNSYREVSEDYITNNQTSSEEGIVLKSYWTDLKETQYRLVFTKRIKDAKAKTLRPKQIVKEQRLVLQLEHEDSGGYFYVYGHGQHAGAFIEAGDAVEMATELAGVVVSTEQNYIWEADNRTSWYRNFEVAPFTVKDGENKLAACVRKILAYEGNSTGVDVMEELSVKTPEEVISEQLETEAVRFRDCSVKDMFYLIDKGVPVIALRDNTDAIVFVGYDAKTATYIDPTNGGTYASSIEKIDEMLKGSGNTFIGYIK